jgi:Uma2 family endonuclease
MPYPLLAEAFPDAEIHYPDTDGEPMAESDVQRRYLTYAVEALERHFSDREDVYVSGNLLVYYEEGNPRACVAPDCFVVFGVANRQRRTYKLWQEDNQPPVFVLEITSASTHAEDQGSKRGLYAYLGVREYWQYDPTGDYLEPRLQGLRLIEGEYRSIRRSEPFGQALYFASEVLGLELHLRGEKLRFRDPVTGRDLPDYAEIDDALQAAETAQQAAEERALLETRQRVALEARLAELEARLQDHD